MRRSRGPIISAEDLALEAKVQQATKAYRTGQFSSILAAAKAHGAPYNRTRSRCAGHHTRHENSGPRRLDGAAQDLLKQLIQRFDKYEATIQAGAASLEQSLKNEFTKHIAERDEEIKVFQDCVMDLEVMVVSQTEKIKHLEEFIF